MISIVACGAPATDVPASPDAQEQESQSEDTIIEDSDTADSDADIAVAVDPTDEPTEQEPLTAVIDDGPSENTTENDDGDKTDNSDSDNELDSDELSFQPATVRGALQAAEVPPFDGEHPTMADLWDRKAGFADVVDPVETGLPRGESETIITADGQWVSYVHASDWSADTVDQCGDPVDFPGCVVLYTSDDGTGFAPADPPVCQLSCLACPCDSEMDHIDQQQYPDVYYYEPNETLYMVYEYRGQTKLWTSKDGAAFGDVQHVGKTGAWTFDYMACDETMEIKDHPNSSEYSDCLAGGPPGIFVEDDMIYVFAAFGKNPGKMGCFKGTIDQRAEEFAECDNILFYGADSYGDVDLEKNPANPYFDFKTVSSAEVVAVGEGEDRRYYMLYEGVRGPRRGDPGDTQFGVGLARSKTNEIDGEWEKYPGNPLLLDLPGNVGVGHADIVVHEGITYIYTSLNGVDRSRLRVAWFE